MIAFDLKCSGGHIFEGWFGSSAAYETQREGQLISCPFCGDADVAKAVMAPNIGTKGNRQSVVPAPAPVDGPPPEVVKAAMAALAGAQAKLLEKSEWVGVAFADKARAMHLGETPAAPIHGQATLDEARALADEGVPVAPLPLPVIPPERRN
ncbi:DUF1178 family protein [Sphingomonas sp. M1-B02]|uniref:DUF1178 family protein n=1 Tax=Sphingomonas sp. M1-B02 TaxID=3114300 RepID=UPI00223FF776|nr:DUF1178 family protein [Sphingomonas sp. S6-11]UZK66378.1 DUF1178 family protein [Sphingomonas sp. S6-11]